MIRQEWRNWAGTARCRPARVFRPATEEELIAAVKSAAAAGRRLRVAGSGHSFSPVACTDGYQIDLREHAAVLATNTTTGLVTVQAGVQLSRLNAELAAVGLALPNLGDVAYQSVAGAIATGTHGTGIGLGNLSTAVAGLRLVTADGTVLECSAREHPEVFGPARIGVGLLGAVSTVTLRTVPAFTLHAVEEVRRLDRVLGELDELVAGNEHCEFFWFPGTEYVLLKRNNRTEEPARPRGAVAAWANDVLLSNVVLDGVCRLARRWPAASRVLHEVVPRLGRTEYSDASYRVFTSIRTVRFTELEYAVPVAAFGEVYQRLRRLAAGFGRLAFFPWECRFVAGDDIALSPASGRDTAYVAVQLYQGIPYRELYAGAERIFAEYDGRPHWGKLHSATAEQLAPRYPRWDEFQAARRIVDPGGLFGNDHTDQVLGPAR